MAKHNLRTCDVATDGTGARVGSEEVEGLTRTAQLWEGVLARSIADAFDGRAIRTRYRGGWQATFIAGISDLEIIVDLYSRLRIMIKKMSKAYVTKKKEVSCVAPKTLHNSYRHGVVQTISKRLDALKKNTTPAPVYGGGKDLMVVKSKAVDQVTTRLFPRLGGNTRTSTLNISNGAYAQGKADGNNVSLHRSVSGGSGPLSIGA